LSGRLGPWRSRCVAWEVAANRGRGAGGWRAVAASWGRGAGGWRAAAAGQWRGVARSVGAGRPRLQLARGKTKYKSVECKEKHKFVCSVAVRIVYLRQEVHGSMLHLFKFFFVFSIFSYITLFFPKFFNY
jgi:hypothetical protein